MTLCVYFFSPMNVQYAGIRPAEAEVARPKTGVLVVHVRKYVSIWPPLITSRIRSNSHRWRGLPCFCLFLLRVS